MRKSMKIASFSVLIILLGVQLISCKGKIEPFRVAFNTWIGYGPLYIAQEKGFFKANNLNVELLRMEGTGERRAALITNRIEALGSTIDDFVLGLTQGLNGIMVLAIDESNGADGIVARNGITSIKDFKNKKVAVQPGFVNHFFLLYLLQTESLTQDDIIVFPMEPDKAANALISGSVDVAVTWEPHLSIIKNQEGYNLILTTSDEIAQHLIVDNLIVREDVLRKRRKDVENFLKAWFDALNFMNTNRTETDEILAKAFELDTNEVEEMLRGVKFISLNDNITFFDKEKEFSLFSVANKALELYTNANIIEYPSRAEPLIDKIDGDLLTKIKQ